MPLCRRALALRTASPWWRPAAVASGLLTGAGAALALRQAVDLGRQWKTQLRGRAAACQGATEGLERRSGKDAPILLLFLGDSLVSGVGAQAEGAPSPAALPKNVATRLADCLGGHVQWASVGITGADVQRLREEGLPRLREKIASHKGARTVVVVLVVGVNDLRKMKVVSYRLALRGLVNELRCLGGRDRDGPSVDAIMLPALRIADAPMLQHYPLQCFLAPVCALWEREKRKAVTWFREAEVLPFPAPPHGTDLTALFSADQMHPSVSGYEWWAETLARQIHRSLQERRARMQSYELRREAWLPTPWTGTWMWHCSV